MTERLKDIPSRRRNLLEKICRIYCERRGLNPDSATPCLSESGGITQQSKWKLWVPRFAPLAEALDAAGYTIISTEADKP